MLSCCQLAAVGPTMSSIIKFQRWDDDPVGADLIGTIFMDYNELKAAARFPPRWFVAGRKQQRRRRAGNPSERKSETKQKKKAASPEGHCMESLILCTSERGSDSPEWVAYPKVRLLSACFFVLCALLSGLFPLTLSSPGFSFFFFFSYSSL